jgi:hypothetical protein
VLRRVVENGEVHRQLAGASGRPGEVGRRVCRGSATPEKRHQRLGRRAVDAGVVERDLAPTLREAQPGVGQHCVAALGEGTCQAALVALAPAEAVRGEDGRDPRGRGGRVRLVQVGVDGAGLRPAEVVQSCRDLELESRVDVDGIETERLRRCRFCATAAAPEQGCAGQCRGGGHRTARGSGGTAQSQGTLHGRRRSRPWRHRSAVTTKGLAPCYESGGVEEGHLHGRLSPWAVRQGPLSRLCVGGEEI